MGGWDVHTHLVPPLVIAAAEGGAYGMAVEPGKLHVCSHGVGLQPISDSDKLVARVKSDGLDGAIVSVPPSLFRPDLSASERRAYCDLVNDALRDACGRHGGVLRPLAYLPAEDPFMAADIAARLDHAWAGAVMGTQLRGLLYSASDYDSLWRVLAERGLALFLHPGASPDGRLDDFYLGNLLGNPVETTVAAAHIVFAGVFDRFPELKIILAHGGGCTVPLAGRWRQGADTRRPGISKMPLMPFDAVRRFYVDSLVHSSAYLDMLLAILGAERILFGSDWPFPMGASSAEHDLGPLTDELKQRIRRTNAETVFGERLCPAPGKSRAGGGV